MDIFPPRYLSGKIAYELERREIMKKLFQLSALLMALILVATLLPSPVMAVGEESVINVGDNVFYIYYNANANQVFETPSLGLWPAHFRFSGSKLGACWDRDYVYISLEKTNAQPTITLNGVTLSNAVVKTTDTHTLVKAPLADANILMDAFAYTCPLKFAVGNDTIEATVVFEGEEGLPSDTTPSINSSTSAYGAEADSGNHKFWVEEGGTNYSAVYYRNISMLKSGNTANVIEFDFTAVSLPEISKLTPSYMEICKGLSIQYTDETLTSVQDQWNAFSYGICNYEGELCIVVDAGMDIETRKREPRIYKTGFPGNTKETIHVRAEFDNMNAYNYSNLDFNKVVARFYVNGKLIGIDQDAKGYSVSMTRGTCAYYILAVPDGKSALEFTVNNLRFGYLNSAAVAQNALEELNFNAFKGENLSESGLTADLVLPKYLPGGQLNGLELEWTSNNESTLTSEGKLVAGGADSAVELTATIKKYGFYKKFFLGAADDAMVVPGSKNGVTLDGSLSDRGWSFLDKISGTKNPVSMGALWTESDLYLALETTDVSDMTFIVNGKNVASPAVMIGDKYTEIQISLADVGLTGAVGSVFPVTILADGIEWIGEFTFGEVDKTLNINDIFMIALIAACVIFAVLLVLALVKKMYKKVWFIIILVVVLLAGVFCGIGLSYQIPFDDGRSAMPKYQIPDSALAALMPKPVSEYGSVVYSNDNAVLLEILDVDSDEFEAYAKVLRNSTFIHVLSDQKCGFTAYNADGKYINAIYQPWDAKMYVSVYNEYFLPRLIQENIRVDDKIDIVTHDLYLPIMTDNGESGFLTDISWSSSNPNVISATGQVTRPDFGIAEVILTATINETGEMKHFVFRVPGYDYNDGKLVVENDHNPAAGIGLAYKDPLFTFDKTNNSVVLDLGEKQNINYVVLNDVDDVNSLAQTNLSLWVSDDNMTYEKIDNVKVLFDGKQTYIYNFETEARYVKAHYGLCPDGLNANYNTGLGEMIEAGYEEYVGGKGAEFKTTEFVLTNNTGKDQLDYAWKISKSDLGITGSNASIRIFVGDEQLYHYVSGNDVMIRIPDLLAGESVTLKILSSDSDNVLDMANKEYVYEVTYGYREQWSTPINKYLRFRVLLEKGLKYPSGRVQEETVVLAQGSEGMMYTSKDGGLTWEKLSMLNGNPGPGGEPIKAIGGIQGYLLDTHTNRLFAAMRYTGEAVYTDGVTRYCYTITMAYSDDGGLTWNLGQEVPYSLDPAENNGVRDMYSDGMVSPTYDGDGPNVDFVWHAGQTMYEGKTGAMVYARPIYSRDGGKTWERTETFISGPLDFGGQETATGLSEGMTFVRDDGVIVDLIRSQYEDQIYFAVVFSTDGGATWSEVEDSRVYAVNTCPIFHEVDINGETTTMVNCGGFNAMGGFSFYRVPLMFAHTTNGEFFRNYQNASFQSHLDTLAETSIMTNTSYTVDSNGIMTSAWQNVPEDAINHLRIVDFDKWYTRTKGAYDSFENGNVAIEGWMVHNGDVTVDRLQASDGRYALHAKRITKLTRTIPYLQDGRISMKVYAGEGTRLEIELQSAYTNVSDSGVAPVGVQIKDNVITLLGTKKATEMVLVEGWNTLVFDLNLTEGKATFQLNDGAVVDMPVDLDAGDYVSYVTLLGKTEYFIDEFLVESETEVALSMTDEDKAAAKAVIAEIKAMGTDKTAIAAARTSYNNLTLVQQDYVNRYTFENGKKTNYYQVLVAAEKG